MSPRSRRSPSWPRPVSFESHRCEEKFGGDSIGDFVAARRSYLERIPWLPGAPASHLALAGFMGAGKSTAGSRVAS